MEIDKKEYGKYVKQVTPVHNTWKNLWRAFLVGGLICMLGQVFTSVYMSFGIEKESAAAWTTLSPQRDPDRVSCVPEDRKIRWSRGPGSHHRICEFRGVPGNRVQGGGPCLRDRLQDLYDRGTGDPLRDPCELGAGDGEVFLEILVNEPAGTYNGERRCGGCVAYEQRQHGISGGKREISIDLYAHKKPEYFLRPEAGETDVGARVLFEDAGVGA